MENIFMFTNEAKSDESTLSSGSKAIQDVRKQPLLTTSDSDRIMTTLRQFGLDVNYFGYDASIDDLNPYLFNIIRFLEYRLNNAPFNQHDETIDWWSQGTVQTDPRVRYVQEDVRDLAYRRIRVFIEKIPELRNTHLNESWQHIKQFIDNITGDDFKQYLKLAQAKQFPITHGMYRVPFIKNEGMAMRRTALECTTLKTTLAKENEICKFLAELAKLIHKAVTRGIQVFDWIRQHGLTLNEESFRKFFSNVDDFDEIIDFKQIRSETVFKKMFGRQVDVRKSERQLQVWFIHNENCNCPAPTKDPERFRQLTQSLHKLGNEDNLQIKEEMEVEDSIPKIGDTELPTWNLYEYGERDSTTSSTQDTIPIVTVLSDKGTRMNVNLPDLSEGCGITLKRTAITETSQWQSLFTEKEIQNSHDFWFGQCIMLDAIAKFASGILPDRMVRQVEKTQMRIMSVLDALNDAKISIERN